MVPEFNVATGEFDYREADRSGEGQGFHADVDCLEVGGNEAWIRLTVSESTHPDHAEGDTLIAYAEDNDDGRGDLFDLRDEDDDPFNDTDCDRDDDEGTSIRRDIVVEEGGFAGGRS